MYDHPDDQEKWTKQKVPSRNFFPIVFRSALHIPEAKISRIGGRQGRIIRTPYLRAVSCVMGGGATWGATWDHPQSSSGGVSCIFPYLMGATCGATWLNPHGSS